MRMKLNLKNLKSKLSRSCKRFISFFHACFRNVDTTKSSSSSTTTTTTLLSCLCFLNTNNEQRMSQIRPRSSSSSLLGDSRKMFPWLMTRGKEKMNQRDMLKEDVVKEACRNFENYLIHMIVEEGKIDDVMDMEELHYYWKNLKNPIFVDIVTRFYGDICTDLFPSDDHDD